ncbi:hypothetical protein EYF80_033577 [Liparis tanakae]|uniref:Uncharacterized protein n=1 Tax=Liparis tanakae TaxID=230148 RepID=A0A4Z2GSB3_9TELE|nr:hypothetical protein EYF80_033577 [Liparis tanakae]
MLKDSTPKRERSRRNGVKNAQCFGSGARLHHKARTLSLSHCVANIAARETVAFKVRDERAMLPTGSRGKSNEYENEARRLSSTFERQSSHLIGTRSRGRGELAESAAGTDAPVSCGHLFPPEVSSQLPAESLCRSFRFWSFLASFKCFPSEGPLSRGTLSRAIH